MSLKRFSRLYKPTFGSDSPWHFCKWNRIFSTMGQTEERSRFPCVESFNCTHGKYLHFKGAFACLHNVWHRCTSWSWLIGIGISTTRECSLCALYNTHIMHILCNDELLETQTSAHSFKSARVNCETSSSAMHYSTPCALTVKWIFLDSREQRQLFELLNKRMNCC